MTAKVDLQIVKQQGAAVVPREFRMGSYACTPGLSVRGKLPF